MIPMNKILASAPRILMCFVVFSKFLTSAYPGVIYEKDTINTTYPTSSFYIDIASHPADLQQSTTNFYKRDSIFSFRSPKGYFPSLGYNFGEQATAPLRFTGRQWVVTGIAAGITTALMFVDGDIDEWARVQKEKHNWVNKTSPFITNFGGNNGVYSAIAVGVISAVFKNEKGVQSSLLATQAMITSGVWVNLIKILTGRERPMADYVYSKTDAGMWYGPFAKYDQDLALRKPITAFDAFPSGHTATAFSIATVFATQYKDKKAIPILCYTAASLVGISRLTEHEHWASDVFVGGLMGYLCGKQVVNHYNKIHPGTQNPLSPKSENQVELTFIQTGNQVGINLRW